MTNCLYHKQYSIGIGIVLAIMFRKDQIKCNYCPDTVQLIEDYQAGDLICSGCGLVIGDRVIDVGAEWRTFSNDTLLNKSRVGAEENILYDGMDLVTVVGATNSSMACDESGERKYRNKKYLTSSQRTLVCGFKEIAEMAEKLNTTRPVIESGQLIFKKIQTKQALKGRSNEAIAAACLYVAYRKNCVPRTFKEICAVSKASKRDIGKCYKVISKEIGEVIMHTSIVDYIPRFVAHLNLPTKIENQAKQIIETIDKIGILLGRSPTTIAALAIYMALEKEEMTANTFVGDNCKLPPFTDEDFTDNKKSLKQISEVTGAAESTIRDVYQILRTQAANQFPDVFADNGVKRNEIPN